IYFRQKAPSKSRQGVGFLGDASHLFRRSMLLLMLAFVLTSTLALPNVSAGEPLKLHPANPHYFLFRGHPTVLITSGEHYGAVLNLDFDCIPYLDELPRAEPHASLDGRVLS
ncbi:MAG: hypothetical protein ACRD2L_18310, partial [Terriglobia bacterium]